MEKVSGQKLCPQGLSLLQKGQQNFTPGLEKQMVPLCWLFGSFWYHPPKARKSLKDFFLLFVLQQLIPIVPTVTSAAHTAQRELKRSPWADLTWGPSCFRAWTVLGDWTIFTISVRVENSPGARKYVEEEGVQDLEAHLLFFWSPLSSSF